MTNAIEQTRREMYEALKKVNACFGDTLPMAKLESAMEAHLEELRKAMVAGNAVIVDCAQHSAESFIALESRAASLTEERDTLRNRIQVLEMASETKAEVIRGLMGDVSALKESLNNAGATTHQESAENASGAITDATMTVLGAMIDCRQLVSDWAVYGFKAKKQMRKLADVLNGDPKLIEAMKSFEAALEEVDGCERHTTAGGLIVQLWNFIPGNRDAKARP